MRRGPRGRGFWGGRTCSSSPRLPAFMRRCCSLSVLIISCSRQREFRVLDGLNGGVQSFGRPPPPYCSPYRAPYCSLARLNGGARHAPRGERACSTRARSGARSSSALRALMREAARITGPPEHGSEPHGRAITGPPENGGAGLRTHLHRGQHGGVHRAILPLHARAGVDVSRYSSRMPRGDMRCGL